MRSDPLYTSSRPGDESSSADPVDVRLLRGLAQPFSEGVALWAKSLPALSTRVAMPFAGALALLVAVGWERVQRLVARPDALAGADLGLFALLYAAAIGVGLLAAASVGAQLSSVHRHGRADGALGEAAKGLVPWLLTYLLVGIAVTLASFAFVVPGI